jgi:hypothetical protein
MRGEAELIERPPDEQFLAEEPKVKSGAMPGSDSYGSIRQILREGDACRASAGKKDQFIQAAAVIREFAGISSGSWQRRP